MVETLEIELENEYHEPCKNKDISKVGYTFYHTYCEKCDSYGNVSNPSSLVKRAVCKRYEE